MMFNNKETLIADAEVFDPAKHNIYMLNSGNEFIENIIHWRAGKRTEPVHAEYVYAVYNPKLEHAPVVAYSSGSLVTMDGASSIHIEVVAVDQNYQGMGLGGTASGRVVEALYKRQNKPSIEVRAIDAIGTHSTRLWRGRGFKHIAGSDDMTLMLCPTALEDLRAWQPRLRPGLRITSQKTTINMDALDLSFGKRARLALG